MVEGVRVVVVFEPARGCGAGGWVVRVVMMVEPARGWVVQLLVVVESARGWGWVGVEVVKVVESAGGCDAGGRG